MARKITTGVGGDDVSAPLNTLIVIVGEIAQDRRLANISDASVVPHVVGLVAVDQFLQFAKPKSFPGRLSGLAVQNLQTGVTLSRDVLVIPEKVVGVVAGHHELHPVRAIGL